MLFLLLLGTSQNIFADVADCINAYQSQKYKDAYRICEPLANKGDPDAQYILGRLYEEGDVIKKNYAMALQWYKKSAAQNHVAGQYYTAHMYYEGLGVAKDYKQAYAWTVKAAKQQFIPAYYNLGLMYQYGDGVKKNENEAFKWYQKAALAGDAAAQFAYGVFLLQGKGVKRNKAHGYAWILLAAERGARHAIKEIDYIKKNMLNADDVIKAEEMLKKIRLRFNK